ncbi:hypothetical protein CREGCYN_15000 [Synechococcus sp. M16CYN]
MIHADDQSAELLDFLLGFLVLPADLIGQELDFFGQLPQLGPHLASRTEMPVGQVCE